MVNLGWQLPLSVSHSIGRGTPFTRQYCVHRTSPGSEVECNSSFSACEPGRSLA
ncbi:hypothetical protein QE385_003912 [Sphingomonas sp. SORGH_AS 950]|nr:hypothetical protein [Sphingomonas sp. SORGH_AS_0950]